GGLRGVVWTDCVQAFLSLVAPATIIIKVVVDSYGGTKKLAPLSELNPSVYFLDTSLDFTKDENLWACLIAIMGFHLYFLCLEQMLVQRSMSCRSLKEAQRTSYSGILLMVFFHILRSFTALALIYWYRNCDPLLTGEITKVDQILPFYVSQHLSEFPGFSGIFLAGVVSASTSTVSSAINSIAAVLYVDVVSHHFAMTERRAATFTRVLAFGIGFIMTLFGVLIPHLGSAAKVIMAVYSAVTGPFSGLIMLALMFPWANNKGAGVATLLMISFQLWHMSEKLRQGSLPDRMPVSVDFCPANISAVAAANHTILTHERGSNSSFDLTELSTYWSNFFTTILTMVLGLIFSLFTGLATLSTKSNRSNLVKSSEHNAAYVMSMRSSGSSYAREREPRRELSRLLVIFDEMLREPLPQLAPPPLLEGNRCKRNPLVAAAAGSGSAPAAADFFSDDEQQSSSAMMAEKTYKFQDPRIIKLTDEADISSSSMI
ncbi:hypothetical protein HPB47_023925, partial [Ixodes persulcatus]